MSDTPVALVVLDEIERDYLASIAADIARVAVALERLEDIVVIIERGKEGPMTNSAKDKGTRFESSIVELFRDTGWPSVERRALRGANDGGDIAGLPGIVIECKAAARVDLSGWLKETAAEVRNAKADMGAVVFKRRGKTNPGDQYVLMDAATLVWLLAQAGR